MRYTIVFLFFIAMGSGLNGQPVRNTSYTNQSGEKVLRLECVVPADIPAIWKYFTQDEKIKLWMAPVAHIELKSGGYIVTNYDTTKSLSDSSSIVLPIISFIDNELLVLKVNLNGSFPESTRKSDDHLQEIIQFIKVDDKHTNIISSMTGWGAGSDWDNAYNFFAKGNEWTYSELLKCFSK